MSVDLKELWHRLVERRLGLSSCVVSGALPSPRDHASAMENIYRALVPGGWRVFGTFAPQSNPLVGSDPLACREAGFPQTWFSMGRPPSAG